MQRGGSSTALDATDGWANCRFETDTTPFPTAGTSRRVGGRRATSSAGERVDRASTEECADAYDEVNLAPVPNHPDLRPWRLVCSSAGCRW